MVIALKWIKRGDGPKVYSQSLTHIDMCSYYQLSYRKQSQAWSGPWDGPCSDGVCQLQETQAQNESLEISVSRVKDISRISTSQKALIVQAKDDNR